MGIIGGGMYAVEVIGNRAAKKKRIVEDDEVEMIRPQNIETLKTNEPKGKETS